VFFPSRGESQCVGSIVFEHGESAGTNHHPHQIGGLQDPRSGRRDAESIIKQREIDQLKARLAAIEAALSKLTNIK